MKKKILHILVKDKKAGAESVVQNIVFHKELSKEFDFKVLILSQFWRSSSLLFPENTISLAAALFQRWSIIHTHLFWAGLMGFAMRCSHPRTRWIHSLHYAGYFKLKWGAFKKRVDANLVFRRADHLHGVSLECQDIIPAGRKIKIIENFFEFKARDYKHPQNSQLEILTVAFFREEKGFDRIIETAKILKNKKITFNWTLCGDGPLFETFKNDLKTNQLHNYFSLQGFQSDLEHFYLKADIYIQPSYTESFGLSTYEAFQYRLPVVASQVGHLKKSLADGLFGTLIPSTVNFSKKLAEAIESFSEDQTSFAAKAQNAYDHYYIQNQNSDLFYQEWAKFYNLQSIIFLSPITTQATGGIQKQLNIQTQEISRTGYEVFIVQKYDSHLNINNNFNWSHCQFYQCFHFKKGSHYQVVQRLNGLIFIIHGFFLILKIRNIKAIHALQMYSPTLLAVLAKMLIKCRVVVKVTASGELGEVSQLKILPFQNLRMKAFKKVDCFLALTEPMKQELINYGIKNSNIQVVPNSVEFFTERDLLPLEKNECFNVLYTGRISTEKSLQTLIDAAVLLAQKFSERKFKVQIVGSVYESRNNFDELLMKAGRAPSNLKIDFEGFKKNIQPYYENAHVFCLPSFSEGMSNALLEAMSHGLPCIVSDIAANTALIATENNGLTFQVSNHEDLFKQLSRVLVDQTENNSLLSRRLSKASHLFIQTYFSVQAVCDKIKRAYQEN